MTRPPLVRSPLFFVSVVVCIVLGTIALALWWPSEQTPPEQNTNSKTNSPGEAGSGSAGNVNNASNVSPEPEPMTTYTDRTVGFSIDHPESWNVVKNNNEDPENPIINYTFGTETEGVTLVVVPASMEGIVRESVSVVNETELTIKGQKAQRLEAKSAKDGSDLVLLIFTKGGMVFVLNGPSDLVERIGGTFTFFIEPTD